jgi:hypothetical protein
MHLRRKTGARVVSGLLHRESWTLGIAAKGNSGSSGVFHTSSTSSARHAGGPFGFNENSMVVRTCVLAYLLRLQLRWQHDESEQGGG